MLALGYIYVTLLYRFYLVSSITGRYEERTEPTEAYTLSSTNAFSTHVCPHL